MVGQCPLCRVHMQSLSCPFPEETVRAWSEFGTQYVTEYSNTAAPAMVTSASTGLSAVDQDIVEDALHDVEYLFDNVDVPFCEGKVF